MLSLRGDTDGAEQNFLLSVDLAVPAGEIVGLRTSTSLLWLGQGERREAYELLARVSPSGVGLVYRRLRHQGFQEANALLAGTATPEMKPREAKRCQSGRKWSKSSA
jgi:hypothetical protein